MINDSGSNMAVMLRGETTKRFHKSTLNEGLT